MSRRLRLVVRGRVQGVFYRAFAQEKGVLLGLTGWVRNCPDSSVELLAEGPEDKLQQLLGWCRQGPPAARVTELEPEWLDATGEYRSFEVRF